MSSVKYERESLMGHAKEACGSGNAPARLFQSSTYEVAFVTKDFGVERKAWRQCHIGGCGCCLVGVFKSDCKHASGTFAQPGFKTKVL